MSSSHTTLTSLWQDDGSPMKSAPATPVRPTELKDDALKYFKESGLESMAKEAGLIDGNGELANSVHTGRHIQLVSLPISGSPSKSLQFLGPPILPKGTQATMVQGPQMVFSAANTRLVSQPHMLTSHSTQSNMVPVQLESPQIIRKRGMANIEIDLADSKKNRKSTGEKGGKGLRHFSMKVCEKVQKKGVTSYNEVADELVNEFSDPRHMSSADQQYDQKNIRRRVYDALNVLMAMNIISKEKKEIRWIGLPTNSAQECQNLEVEKTRRMERIRHKTQQLEELILQQIAFKNLVNRNRELEKAQGPPTQNSAIQLPFIIVNTSKKTVIDCSISNDKHEYLFNFDSTFEIHDDIEVLKRMGMAYSLEKGQCTNDNMKKAVRMVPRALEPYVQDLASSKSSKIGNGVTGNASASLGSARALKAMQASIGSTEATDLEVAMATSTVRGLSRQSSVGSFSDAGPSRSQSETPSEVYSDSGSERSSPNVVAS